MGGRGCFGFIFCFFGGGSWEGATGRVFLRGPGGGVGFVEGGSGSGGRRKPPKTKNPQERE